MREERACLSQDQQPRGGSAPQRAVGPQCKAMLRFSPSPPQAPIFAPPSPPSLPPQETDATLDALLAMQGSASASGGHSRDHVLAELAADIQRRVPLPFDIEAAR